MVTTVHFLLLDFCDYSSAHEQIIEFFSPGSGLDENLPVLGMHISPGGNHLTYRINPPPMVSVSVPITRVHEFKKKFKSKDQHNPSTNKDSSFFDNITLVDINMNRMPPKK